VILSACTSSFAPSHYYGGTVSVGDSLGNVYLVDPIEKAIKLTLKDGHKEGVTHLSFVDTEEHLLVSGARTEKDLLLWDIRNPDAPLKRYSREVRSQQRLSFSICEGKIASGDNVLLE